MRTNVAHDRVATAKVVRDTTDVGRLLYRNARESLGLVVILFLGSVFVLVVLLGDDELRAVVSREFLRHFVSKSIKSII